MLKFTNKIVISTFLNVNFMYVSMCVCVYVWCMYIRTYLTLFPNIYPIFTKFTILETSMLKSAYCGLINPRELCPLPFSFSFVLTILCLSSSALTKSLTSVSCSWCICSSLQDFLNIYIFQSSVITFIILKICT